MCLYDSCETVVPTLKENKLYRSLYRGGTLAIGMGISFIPGGFKDVVGLVTGMMAPIVLLVIPIAFYWGAMITFEMREDAVLRSIGDIETPESSRGHEELTDALVPRERHYSTTMTKQQAFKLALGKNKLRFLWHIIIGIFLPLFTMVFGPWSSMKDLLK